MNRVLELVTLVFVIIIGIPIVRYIAYTPPQGSFQVGDCVRVSETDPWQADTFKITDIGKYSVRVYCVYESGLVCSVSETIKFKELRNQYSKVDCPKESK
jgi:hypothetical protein